MITVNIAKQRNYIFAVKKVKEAVRETLAQNGITAESQVDIWIVDREKMEEMNKMYYKDKVYEHPVFTFPESLGESFIYPPDGRAYLGQIMINYPMAKETAKEQGKTVSEVITSLAEHGSLHLVGIHH